MSAYAVVSTTQPQGTNNNTIATTQFAKLASLPSWVVKTAAYTASHGDFLLVDTTALPVTITLPANPVPGAVINFSDPTNMWGTNNLTILGNGNYISSQASPFIADVSGFTFYLFYVGAPVGWKAYSNTSSVPGKQGDQGLPGNTTIPANAAQGNIPSFSSVSGSMVDSGINASSLSTFISNTTSALTTVTNNITTNTNSIASHTTLLGTHTGQITNLLNSTALMQIDINYVYLQMAALRGTQVGMIDGIIDPLNNLLDVSLANSLGYAANSSLGTVSLGNLPGNQYFTVSTSAQGIVSGFSSSSFPFDGTFTLTNSASSGSTVAGAYIGQDFGLTPYAITQIYLYSDQDPSTINIQYSDDMSVWTTATTSNPTYSSTTTLKTFSIPANTGAHRGWRVYAQLGNTAGYWQISEASFQITVQVGSIVSNQWQSIADSAYSSSYIANYAFDGATSGTNWASNNASAVANQSWIGQDFGNANSYAISQVFLYMYSANLFSNGSIQYSDNGSAWTTAMTIIAPVASGIGVYTVPSAAGSHRYWRLLIGTCTANPGLCELQFQITGTLASVSTQGQAIASSTSAGSAAYAFDQIIPTASGSTNYWQAGEAVTAQSGISYIGQDFGNGYAYAVNNIVYYPDVAGTGFQPNTLAVQYADSPSGPWTSVMTWAPVIMSAYGACCQVAVPYSGAHRCWRLLALANSASQWAVYELIFQTLMLNRQVSSPMLAISGGDYSGGIGPALAAFENNVNTAWQSSQNSGTPVTNNASLGQDFGSGNTVTLSAFSIQQSGPQSTSVNSNITAIWLQYSDNGTAWTNWSYHNLSSNLYVNNVFLVPQYVIQPHRYWRVLASANTSTASSYSWVVSELVFYALAPIYTGYTLQSVVLPSAVANPSSGRIFLHLDSSSAVPGASDLAVAISKDSGTTFVPGTLSLIETLPDGTSLYDTGSYSLSSAPTGNATMTYKIVTANSKNIVLTGVGMQVRP